MNAVPSTMPYLNEVYPVRWKGHITCVCCPIRVDDETASGLAISVFH